MLWAMRTLFVAIVCLAACSREVEVDRTVSVAAEQLAAIKAEPYQRRFKSGGGPAARLAGLDDDPWPEGILFLEYGTYLHEIGFTKGMALHAIDGKRVHRIFERRWAGMAIRRPGGFHRDHYEDLVRYLFDAEPGETRIVTLYRDVPSWEREIGSYTPKIEHWALVFEPE